MTGSTDRRRPSRTARHCPRCVAAVLMIAAIALLPQSAAARHPVSVTEAVVYVQQDKISVKIDVFVEDLFLFQNVKPDDNNCLPPDALAAASVKHQQFLLDRFILRDAQGERLVGEPVGIDQFDMPEKGVPMGDLMTYAYGYRFDYPLQERPAFLTVTQQLIDEAAGIPAEMNLRVKQEGSESPFYAVLNPGEPVTLRFNWDSPPLAPDASEEQWEEWIAQQREETLGITSYSSVYSFVYITDREVRHEILAPLMTLETSVLIPRRDEAFLEVDEQDEAAEQIAAFFLSGNPVKVNGVEVPATLDRVDFYGVDFKDFAQRAPKRRVSMASARAGVIIRYPLTQPPEQVEITWNRFNRYIWNVRSIIYAYEENLSKTFSRYGSDQTFLWTSPAPPPLPEIQPVAAALAQPPRWRVPIVSLSCLAAIPVMAAMGWGFGVNRRWRAAAALALGIAAVGTWSLGSWTIADPFARTPPLTEAQASEVFSRLHANMYQAFEYRTESEIYDALARSVDGPLLQDLYLQIQKGLAMQEQGGAISQIEDVKLVSADTLTLPESASQTASFQQQGRWTVAGTVEHWGHIHKRTNQYDAQFEIAQRDGAWKIVDVQLLDEQRIDFETRLRGLN